MVVMNGYTTSAAKTCAIKLVVLLVCLEFTNAQRLCPKDNYIIIDGKGTNQGCFPCHNCAEGQGLVPACGTQITEFQKRLIFCEPCIAGHFSDEYGPSSCKPCSICSENEKVIRKCTIDKNSICSNRCQTGYYFDNITTHECQRCSYCCNDAKDVRIDECKAHGIPAGKQCSIHRDIECIGPQTTNKPRSRAREISTSGEIPSDLSTGEVVAIVAGCVVIISILVLFCILYAPIILWYRRNQ